MATFVTRASGNINATATWAQALNFVATRSTNLVLLGTTTTSSNTPSFVLSTAVDAVGLQVAGRSASPTGTMTVELYDINAASVAGTCTINVSDIVDSDGQNGGWYVFKFSGGAHTAAGNTYTVRPYTSSSAQVYLWRATATTNDWSKFLRGSSSSALALNGSDQIIIAGEHTGAGAKTDWSVTVDYDMTQQFNGGSTGDSSETNPSVWINRGGTLTFATTDSSAYTLICSGLGVFAGGTLQVGTTGTPMPSNSTALVDIRNNGMFTVVGGATFIAQGSPRTSGNPTVFTKLTANAAVNATSLTVADSTGWLSGDTIAVASTTRTATGQHENRALSVNATASTLTLASNTTYAHLGDTTNEMQAHVILLNRNVRLIGESAKPAVVRWTDDCSVDCDWAEFRYVSTNATNKRGINIYRRNVNVTRTANISLVSCSIRDSANYAINADTASNGVTLNISNTCIYNYGTAGTGYGLYIPDRFNGLANGTPNAIIVDNVVIMGSTSANPALYFDVGSDSESWTTSYQGIKQVSNVVCTSVSGMGIQLRGFYYTPIQTNQGVFRNWESYACSSYGAELWADIIGLDIDGIKCWRNNNYGIILSGDLLSTRLKNILAIGNATTNIYAWSGVETLSLTIQNARLFSDVSFSTSYGFFTGSTMTSDWKIRFEGCDFGSTTNAVRAVHAVNDVNVSIGTGYTPMFDMVFDHCLFGATTPIFNLTTLVAERSMIRLQNYNRVVGDDRTYHKGGNSRRQNTVSITGQAIQLSPANTQVGVSTSMGQRGRGFLVPATGGTPITGNVSVRIDNTYNGTSPRVLVLSSYACGINSAAVLNTHSAAANTWQSLNFSVTPTANGVLEFIVDCKANTGSVYVDNWQVS